MKTYKGLLSLHSCGDIQDVLFLSSVYYPLAEELEWMNKRKVIVHYLIADQPCTREQAPVGGVKALTGEASCEFRRYGEHDAEYCEYLLADEKLSIDDHDLIDELKSNVGKWLILEIEESD